MYPQYTRQRYPWDYKLNHEKYKIETVPYIEMEVTSSTGRF